ncbi:MAG TPA: tetratricopeptide repeat protein [Thermoanaerobaculia bacterium]|jgi:tetratricopeptide (TPR) repeat protein|nr:tetratricopeptide repeat protein [Thermoanaerobaculia bacterium]
MKTKTTLTMIAVFTLGIAVGAFAAKKTFDSALYRGQDKKEAGKALLEMAKKQAGKGSWERIGVGRVYYLGGMKAEGQAIFDEVTAKKPEPTDWWRIGRVYWEAGEWDKARAAFEKSLDKNPNDDKGLAELGAYYLLKGDREKAEELFDKSYSIEQSEVWNTSMIAGAYLGVKPQE